MAWIILGIRQMTRKLTDNMNADEQARDWVLKLYSQDVSDAQRMAFRQWLEASPEHALAFQNAERVWEEIGMTDAAIAGFDALVTEDQTPGGVVPTAMPRKAFSTPALAAGVAAVFVLGAATISMLTLWPSGQPVTYVSAIGETKNITLEDGSTVTLGPASRLSARFADTSRTLRLTKGRAFFDVARDENRPFTVTASQTRIRVLGTAFGVRHGQETVRVSVQEGSVAVADLTNDDLAHAEEVRNLSAGQQVTADGEGRMAATRQADVAGALSWMSGRLVYDGAPLSELVEDLNAYRDTQVEIMDGSLRDMRITTSFTIDEADKVLVGLAESQSLRLSRHNNKVLIFKDLP